MIRREIREKTDGLRPGSGCHGGLPVLPCGAMRGNHDNCSYSPTTLFVALIRTYTLVHKQFACLCFHLHASVSICTPPCSLSLAVSKVGKPRWGQPLVEFVIVGKIRRFAKDSWSGRACSCIHTGIKG